MAQCRSALWSKAVAADLGGTADATLGRNTGVAFDGLLAAQLLAKQRLLGLVYAAQLKNAF